MWSGSRPSVPSHRTLRGQNCCSGRLRNYTNNRSISSLKLINSFGSNPGDLSYRRWQIGCESLSRALFGELLQSNSCFSPVYKAVGDRGRISSTMRPVCGFLASQKDGHQVYYRVTEPHLASIMACIEERFG